SIFRQPGTLRNGLGGRSPLCSAAVEPQGADMLKHIIAMTGCAAVLAVATGAVAAEKAMNLSRKAKSGGVSQLAYSGRWDRNCTGLPVKITFTRQPANGSAWSVEADEVLPASTPGSGNTGPCAGKTIKSKKIMYRSNPGFRGKDTVG